MPLFAVEKGVKEREVAIIILSIIVLPLILSEYKIGILTKKYAVNLFVKIGFSGLFLISILLFLTENIYCQFALIILASVFAAFLEPTLEILFFRQTSKYEEEKFYSLYKTSVNIGSLIAKVLIALVLLVLPNNFAFLIITILISISLITSFKIKK